MHRRRGLRFASIIGSSVLVVAVGTAVATAQSQAELANSANERALLALGRTIPAAAWQQMRLDHAFRELERQLGVSVRPDWPTLAEPGITPDQAVTVSLQAVSAETLLRILLQEAGGPDSRLDFKVRDGAIIVSTHAALRDPIVLHTYATENLLAAPGVGNRTSELAHERAAELQELIQQMVDPDAWEINGGADGRIRIAGSTLLIETRPDLHDQIRSMFAVLRTKPSPHTVIYSTARSRSPRADQAIRAALERELSDVSHDHQPLHAVIADLRQRMRVNVHVSWRCLEDAGIEFDKPISITLRRLPAERVLQIVLDEAGGPDLELGYEIRDGVLIVTMRKRLDDPSELHAHSLAELSQPPPTSLPREPNAFDRLYSELLELIVQTVEPDTWADNGGLGTIQCAGDVLFVRNGQRSCQQVADLLRHLRTPAPGDHVQVTSRVTPPTADKIIRSDLQRTLAGLVLDGKPLSDALNDLLNRLDVNAHVYWQILEDAGVTRDTPIHAHLTGLSIDQALREVLAQAGTDVVLAYEIRDGILVIGTLESLCRHMELHVYRLDRRDQNPAQPNLTTREQLAAVAERRIEVIVRTVYPESWAENGGLGTIESHGDFLVVRNDSRSCRTVARMLQAMSGRD